MAAGWWSPPRTEGSGSWTHGAERSSRCPSEVLSRVCVPLMLTLVVLLQVSRSKSHRANKVLYVSHLKMLLSTGSTPWNHRQVVLWDPVRAGPRAAGSNPAFIRSFSFQTDLLCPRVCRRTYLNRCTRKTWTAPPGFCFRSTTQTHTCCTWQGRSDLRPQTSTLQACADV